MSMPGYNGTNNADDPLVTPWNIAGWTAQAIPQDTIQATQFPEGSGLPTNLVYVQVTGRYLDFDMNPLSGFLTFLTSEDFTVTSGGVTYRMPKRYAGQDNTYYPGGMNNWGSGRIFIRAGLMSVTLMATQNSAIVTDSGNPLTYHVIEHFLGGTQYDIVISDTAVSPVDLRSLIVSGSIASYDYDPQNPLGNESYQPI
jgi:hypothetical protein